MDLTFKAQDRDNEQEYSISSCCAFVQRQDMEWVVVPMFNSNLRVLSLLSELEMPVHVIRVKQRKLYVKISRREYKSGSKYYTAFSFLRWANNTHDGTGKLQTFFSLYDLGYDWVHASYFTLLIHGDNGYYWCFPNTLPPQAVHDWYGVKADKFSSNTYHAATKIGAYLKEELGFVKSIKVLKENKDKIQKILDKYYDYFVEDESLKVGDTVEFKVSSGVLRSYSIYKTGKTKITAFDGEYATTTFGRVPKTFLKK